MACDDGGSATPGSGGAAAGGASSGGGQGGTADAGSPDAAGGSGGVAAFQEVEALLLARAAAQTGANLSLVIWNQADQKVYQRMVGDFTADRNVAIASASKLVSGLVILDVIAKGKLSLEATCGAVLGWTGPNAAITLRHLLSFTSGLPREAGCTLNQQVTLGACVDTIQGQTAVAAPGTRFEYGSTHLHVAARMAEVATGRAWAELFADTLRTPLGLASDVVYYTAPRQATGVINPLIAGGLRASVDDYGKILGLAFHKGKLGSVTVGTPALFDEQAKEPFPGVTIGPTPLAEFRYGLASWLLCDTPGAGCAQLASPGAFGFTPWYDRATGYYAILGMELQRGSGTDGVVEFAVELMKDLSPLIRAALGR